MNQDWKNQYNSRIDIYGAEVIDTTKRIVIKADPSYIQTYSGQVAAIVLSSLLTRLTTNIGFSIPQVELSPLLPFSSESIAEYVLNRARRVYPEADFREDSGEDADFVFTVGSSGGGCIVHGNGWEGFSGVSDSPITHSDAINPIGPAMSAIVAVAEFFKNPFTNPNRGVFTDTYNWQNTAGSSLNSGLSPNIDLGNIWIVGNGSVGSAIAYFLTLFTRNYRVGLFDMDIVKIHNISRSPIFDCDALGKNKADVVNTFLTEAGGRVDFVEECALHESKTVNSRLPGSPDIIVSAANEFNVRESIENLYPPIQIYGTTGKNWQAALLRHIPGQDPCSCCRFSPAKHAATQCATGKVPTPDNNEGIDAALPFLSYAAGLMAAAEIIKLAAGNYQLPRNQIIFNTKPYTHFTTLDYAINETCICQSRDSRIHSLVLKGSKYAHLSHESLI